MPSLVNVSLEGAGALEEGESEDGTWLSVRKAVL